MTSCPSVRTYARIRPGQEFASILDLESFLRKKSGKNIFGLLRVKLPVEICKNTALLERFFTHVKKTDLDISFQLKRGDCMKWRQTALHVIHF